jgi:hypothetical protein
VTDQLDGRRSAQRRVRATIVILLGLCTAAFALDYVLFSDKRFDADESHQIASDTPELARFTVIVLAAAVAACLVIELSLRLAVFAINLSRGGSRLEGQWSSQKGAEAEECRPLVFFNKSILTRRQTLVVRVAVLVTSWCYLWHLFFEMHKTVPIP